MPLVLVRWLVTGLLFVAMARAASAATYYVAASGGDDARSCQTAQNIAMPKNTIASGLPCLGAGDTLYLRSGTYAEQINSNSYTIPTGTSWSNAVTIAAYPSETVTLAPTSGTEVIAFAHSYIQYVILDNLIINATGRTNGVAIVNGGHHIRVQNGEIKNATSQGVFSDGPPTDSLEFINLSVHNNGTNSGDHNFYLGSTNSIVDGCTIYLAAGYGIQLYNGSCSDNTCTSGTIIRKNRIYQNQQAVNGSGGIVIAHGKDILIYNNLIYNNPNGIDVANYGLPDNIQIYNNTITSNTNYGILIFSGVTDTIIQNNIVYNSISNIDDSGTGTVISFNLTTDPSFVNAGAADFHLQSSSNAINAGTTIATVTVDFDSIARPQGAAYDIGAYEFTNAPPSTATATITWTDVAGETEYLIEKSIDGGVTYAALKTVAANTTSTTDTQIVIGTLYCYRVIARNSVGNRAASEPICDTPGIPGRTPAPTVSFVVP